MGIISEVKCARCDRKYSGVRSRCPYCGARRIGRGKYSEEEDNSKGKMWIGVLIMSVLVVASGVLLFATSASDVKDQPTGDPASSPPAITMPGEEGNTSVTGQPVKPTLDDPSPLTSPDPPPSPDVRSVAITYSGRIKTDITVRVNEKVPLKVSIEPLGANAEIHWSSSNTSVFDFVPVDLEGLQISLTGVSQGTGTLTVSVGGVEATCIIRVRPPR